jgi:phosphoesterase RecJ-like protein
MKRKEAIRKIVKGEIERLRGLLQRAQTIAIVGHARPDGDAVGSLLALTLGFRKSGKEVVPILVDGVPNRFLFLPGADAVVREIPPDIDLLIAVDCSDQERIGISPENMPREPDVNIDHHPTNTDFAAVNLVEPDAAATAQILYDLWSSLKLSMDEDIATNLLTGLVTDTIGFRTPNVTAKVLHVAAALIDAGAPLAEIYERSLHQRSYIEARYWGCGLLRLEQADDLIWTSLTLEDRARVGYHGLDDADLINLLTTVAGAKVTLIFVEQPIGRVKVSWRSVKGLSVAGLAESFGGGGHDQASGAMIQGTLDTVRVQVLESTKALIYDYLETGK